MAGEETVVTTESSGKLPGQLRSVFEQGTVAGLTDGQLLRRFVAKQGEPSTAAFTALVERHGPMVERVCRATLHDEHDAQDAFQAVFLVLAAKARSLWVRDSIGPWLHGVAVRTAARARVDAARRKLHEGQRARAAGVQPASGEAGEDAYGLLHEELGRLPDRYRVPLILCDLEGLTHEQAAVQLGWPVGTVKSRQARGRERLRGRLLRRGLTPSVALAAMALDRSASAAHVAALAESTARSVILAHSGALATSPAVLLAEHALRTVAIAWFLRSAVTVAFIAVAAAVLWSVVGGQRTAEPASARAGLTDKHAATPKPKPVPEVRRTRSQGTFHIALAADWTYDFYAAAQSLRADGLENPPAGYVWVRYEDRGEADSRGLILRDMPAGPGRHYKVVLAKKAAEDVTEQDLIAVHWTRDRLERPAVEYRLSPDGVQRLADMTRPRIPRNRGEAPARLVIAVHGTVVATCPIGAVAGDTGTIELGPNARTEEVRRLLAQLMERSESNQGHLRPRPVRDRAEEVREALDVDLPIVECCDSALIEATDDAKARTVLDQPKELSALRQVLMPLPEPPGRSPRAALRQFLTEPSRTPGQSPPVATVSFYGGEQLMRRLLVYEGGEWSIERPGVSWRIGQDLELLRIVRRSLRRP